MKVTIIKDHKTIYIPDSNLPKSYSYRQQYVMDSKNLTLMLVEHPSEQYLPISPP